MADDKKLSDGAVAGITVGGVLGGLGLWLASQKKAGAQPSIPAELMQLLGLIAATDQDILTALENLSFEGASIQGWPDNCNSGTAVRVAITPQTGVQMPDIEVPSGFNLLIMAWPLNPGWLHVGFSMGECININQSHPLLPTGIVTYAVDNANEVFISARVGGGGAPVAGCFACLTVEQRKGGG